MASLRPAITQLRGRCQTSAPQWQQLRHSLQGLHISPKARHTRPFSTRPSDTDSPISEDSLAAKHEADRRAVLSKMIANLNAREQGEGHEQDARPVGEPQLSEPSQSSAAETTFSADDAGDQEIRMGGPGYSDQVDGRFNDGEGSLSNLQDGHGQEGFYRSEDGEGHVGDEPPADNDKPKVPMIYARPMPTSPSYFSRQPEFNDSYLLLQKLMRKYAYLPTAPSDQLPRVAFRSLKDYRLAVGERIKASDYARCMTLIKRLHKIHPDLKPAVVQDAIAAFLRDINPHNQKVKDIPVDRFGRTLGVGKRKTSTARAWVVEGMGEVLVNGKSLADAFGRVHDRESAVWALKATARTDKYNVWALVEGGGTTGQAEALAMAVGKALMAHEPALKPALRRAGVMTRDPRGVERKKTGHLKARKKPAWVKR
ncbi:unnamed protein product [Discula destructiva]